MEDKVNNEARMENQSTTQIMNYVQSSPGLELKLEDHNIIIHQYEDGKNITFDSGFVRDVLERTDRDGKKFIQVNFLDNSKILVTDNLIGFKPFPVKNLDMNKLPKVVTSPDCLSVFEAIDDCLRDESIDFEELDTLKRVFSAIIRGAEMVGFSMENEKDWLNRLVISETEVA